MVLKEKTLESVKGTIEKFLFQSADNGFAIATITSTKNQKVVVKGYLPDLQAGQEVTLFGDWIFHPKFGKQFDVNRYQISLPTSLVGLKKYLGSGMIKGIGKVYAEKLVDHFGDKIMDIIEDNPQKLFDVPGIGEKRIKQIIASWSEQKEISNVMIFLQDKGISSAYAVKIYKKYGQSSVNVLQENPYRLADEIWGVGFNTADQIAEKLGIPKDSIKRVKSGINFAISNVLNQGSLYAELETLKSTAYELLELNPANHGHVIKSAFRELYNKGSIKLIKHDDLHYVTLSQYYYSEHGVAQKINLLLSGLAPELIDVDKIYQQLRSSKGTVQLNDDQQRAIITALQNKITVITGGPGTGKTTLIKQLLGILDDHKITYKLAAPTGRAAKRINEGTGKYATTIHRLLEFDVSTMGFTHNEHNTIKTQYLIIDEASMIDVFLMHAILKALPAYAHLILIGDIDQLPSVGAGNVLGDLIDSNHVACVKLIEIFRQAQDSLIIMNAHRVNRGEFPSSSPSSSKRDFIFIREDSPEGLPKHIENIFKKRLGMHKIAAHKAIVLSPMHRGGAGTQKINVDMQQMINPNNNENAIPYSGYKYKINDRIMQLRNNYDKNIFNGDIGQVTAIDKTEKQLLVNFDGRSVNYDFAELDEVTLAYAISIHKSQGSEYDAVIIPIFTQHFTLLQRNLLYTAITRAKKLCVLIGQPKAIAMAVKNNKTLKRKTFLQQFLTTDLDVI